MVSVMSTETISELVERMLRPLHEALRDPDEHEQGLDALISQTEAQEQLPAAVRRELVASLEKQRKGLQATRLASIGTELRAQLKERFGLVVEVRVAQRRSRKRPAVAPAEASAPTTLAGDDGAPVPETPEPKPETDSTQGGGGGVFGLGRRRTGS